METIGHVPRKKPEYSRANYGAVHQKLREELLAYRVFCEFQGEGCTGWSEEAHHIRYPARSLGDYMAVCKVCHKAIERQK